MAALDPMERARQEYEKRLEKARKREERERIKHEKEMAKLNKNISNAFRNVNSVQRMVGVKTEAYNTEIDLNLNGDRGIYEICNDFRRAFKSTLCFYDGRELANVYTKLYHVRKNGATDCTIHLSGKDSVEVFEDVMSRLGLRVIVKFDEEGPRNKKNLAGFEYDGKGQLRLEEKTVAEEKSTPAEKAIEKHSPKSAEKPAAESHASGDMLWLQLTPSTTIESLRKQFNEAFGAQLRVYNGNKVAAPTDTLGAIGLTAEGTFECRSSLTVASFIEQMKANHGLKVKVYTCDEWVAVLDGLTLESAGKVKKNAVKADMESMIANQRNEGEDKPAQSEMSVKKSATYEEYTIGIMPDNKVFVRKNDTVCDNTKGALREVAEKVGFDYDSNWTTQQFGSKLVGFLNK
ncbi:MAG: hypothetical protein K6E93_08005 [Bacteroidales bacterium]|nr:hypothetical protein [Bacteroidales bacterium]